MFRRNFWACVVGLAWCCLLSTALGVPSPITFGDRNSALKFATGTRFRVASNLMAHSGTISVASGVTLEGGTSDSALGVRGGFLELAGKILGLNSNYVVGSTVKTVTLTGDHDFFAEPGTIISNVVVSGANNRLQGEPVLIGGGISLLDDTATLTIAISTPLSRSINLNGGKLRLDSDLKLADGVQFFGDEPVGGRIIFGGRRLEFGGSPITLTSGLQLDGAGDVVLNSRTELSATWTFLGNANLNGNGNILDLGTTGKIWVQGGTELSLTNIKIKGIRYPCDDTTAVGSIVLEDATSRINLSSVELEFDTNFSITEGETFVEGWATFVTRDKTVTFAGDSLLTIDGETLWYDTLDYTTFTSPIIATGHLVLLNNAQILGSGVDDLSVANSWAIVSHDELLKATSDAAKANSWAIAAVNDLLFATSNAAKANSWSIATINDLLFATSDAAKANSWAIVSHDELLKATSNAAKANSWAIAAVNDLLFATSNAVLDHSWSIATINDLLFATSDAAKANSWAIVSHDELLKATSNAAKANSWAIAAVNDLLIPTSNATYCNSWAIAAVQSAREVMLSSSNAIVSLDRNVRAHSAAILAHSWAMSEVVGLNQELLNTPAPAVTTVYESSWRPDGYYMATVDNGTTTQLKVYQYRDSVLTLIASAGTGYTGAVRSVAWHPDGNHIAIGIEAGAGENRVAVFTFVNEILTSVGTDTVVGATNVSSVAWHPGGNYLLAGQETGSGNGEINLYAFNPATSTLTTPPTTIATHGHDVHAVRWSHDGRYFAIGGTASASGSYTGRVYSFTAPASATLKASTTNGDTHATYGVAWWPNDARVVFTADDTDGTGYNFEGITIYDFDGTTLTTWVSEISALGVKNVVISADGKFLATLAEYDALIDNFRSYNITIDGIAERLHTSRIITDTAPLSAVFNPAQNMLVVCGTDSSVATERLKLFPVRRDSLITSNSNAIAATSSALINFDRLLSREASSIFSTIPSLTAPYAGGIVYTAVWNDNGTLMAIGGENNLSGNEVAVYSYDGSSLSLLPASGYNHNNTVRSLAWHPSGRYMALGGLQAPVTNYGVRVLSWNGASFGELTGCRANHGNWVLSVAWHPSGNYLAIGGDNGTSGFEIRVYKFDSTAGAESLTLCTLCNINHGGIIYQVKWHPGGNYLAVAGVTGLSLANVRVFQFDATPGFEQLSECGNCTKSHGNYLRTLDWRDDGEQLVVMGKKGSNNTYGRIFNFDDSFGAEALTEVGASFPAITTTSDAEIHRCAFTNHGRTVVAGGTYDDDCHETHLYSVEPNKIGEFMSGAIDFGAEVWDVSWHPTMPYVTLAGSEPDQAALYPFGSTTLIETNSNAIIRLDYLEGQDRVLLDATSCAANANSWAVANIVNDIASVSARQDLIDLAVQQLNLREIADSNAIYANSWSIAWIAPLLRATSNAALANSNAIYWMHTNFASEFAQISANSWAILAINDLLKPTSNAVNANSWAIAALDELVKANSSATHANSWAIATINDLLIPTSNATYANSWAIISGLGGGSANSAAIVALQREVAAHSSAILSFSWAIGEVIGLNRELAGTPAPSMATVYDSAWRADGLYVATVDNGTSNQLKVYSYIDSSITQVAVVGTGYAGAVRSVAWHPDGKHIAVAVEAGAGEDCVVIYSLVNNVLTEVAADTVAGATTVASVAWHPSGNYLLVGQETGSGNGEINIYAFNPATSTLTTPPTTVATHGHDVHAVIWSLAGDFFAIAGTASAGDSCTGRVYAFTAPATATLKDSTTVNDTAISYDVVWWPDGEKLSFAADGGLFEGHIVYTFDGTALAALQAYPSALGVRALAISRDYLFATGAEAGSNNVKLYRNNDGSMIEVQTARKTQTDTSIRSLSFSMAENLLVAVGTDTATDTERLKFYPIARQSLIAANSSAIINSDIELPRNNSYAILSIREDLSHIDLSIADIHLTEFLTTGTVDVVLSDSHKLYAHNSGVFDGHAHKISLRYNGNPLIFLDHDVSLTFARVLFEGFTENAISRAAGSELFFADSTHLQLLHDESLALTWTFSGACTLDGHHSELALVDDGSIVLLPHAALLLKDLTLSGIHDLNVACYDTDVTLSCENVIWLQSDNFLLDKGAFDVLTSLKMVGANQFVYANTMASTIRSAASWTIGPGMTINLQPQNDVRQHIIFEDASAMLHLDGSTLRSSAVGTLFTRGQLVVDGTCHFDSEAITTDGAITFGDGTNASEDFSVTIMPGSKLVLDAGFLQYANVLN